jgi:uncharacterized membrane protein
MTDDKINRTDAQRRADRIRAFAQELDQVEREGVLSLSGETKQRLVDYHGGVLAGLQAQFDVDTTDSERQMSWGMRIASTLGALALAVAAYFFFYRYWGVISTPLQILILVAAPCLAVAGMERVSRRERTLYFTGLIGVVAFSCFVLNISVLGTIFNITPSQNAFIPWGAFGLILAYAYRLRLMLAAGIMSLMAYLTMTVGVWSGAYWIYMGQRPENYIFAGVVTFIVPFVVPHRRREKFPAVYRLLGMLATFIAILVLANWGAISYLKLDREAVEILYQMVGFLLAGLAIWFGIRKGMKEIVNTGFTFFIILLYTKFFDWWWDWMPKYLFFLFLGLIAVGLLFILSRARRTLKGAAS